MRYVCLAVLLTLAIASFGQVPNDKFSELAMDELSQEASAIDGSADAEVLLDKGKVWFDYDDRLGFVYTTSVHRRVKIYKFSALERGSFIIPLYKKTISEGETVECIKGITYNIVNNSINKSKLSKQSIFNEEVSDTYSRQKVTMPNVQVGSVIEYQYEVKTPLSIINKPSTWYFQSDIPVKSSLIDITIPSHFFYQVIMGGYNPLSRNEQEQVNVDMGYTRFNTTGSRYVLEMSSLPAFKDEKFITCVDDYISKIEFELSSISLPGQAVQEYNATWESLDNTMLESVRWGKRFSNAKYIKEIAQKYQGLNSNEDKT